MRWNRNTDSVKTVPNNGRTTFIHAAKCWTPNDAADGCRRLQNTPEHNQGKYHDTERWRNQFLSESWSLPETG